MKLNTDKRSQICCVLNKFSNQYPVLAQLQGVAGMYVIEFFIGTQLINLPSRAWLQDVNETLA